MVPWDQIADFIFGDYGNQVRDLRRLRSSYKSQIRRLDREGQVQAVEKMNFTHIPERVHEAHLDADDNIKKLGDRRFGEYDFDSSGGEKQEVKSEMERVVKACNLQVWKYKILYFLRGMLFLIIVAIVGVIGIGSLI